MWLVLTVAAVVCWTAWTYNRFVRLGQMMTEAWSGVDVQLKRRHDLIPNLVEAVKGYRDYERSVMESVTALRSKAMEVTGVREKGDAESALSREVRHLMAVVEQYPELKASSHFLELHRSLVNVEDEIQMARRYFNGTVRDRNILVESFPSLLVASACGWTKADYFELETVEAVAPAIQFATPGRA